MSGNGVEGGRDLVKRKSSPIYPGRSDDSNNNTNLFKRGNYSMLRLLTIVNAAGPNGITTRKLLDEIRSHDTYTQKVLDKAKDLELIERKTGESKHGHFKPVYNKITDKGKKLLNSQKIM
jgi:DNA-binding MarR family transcriptional regulator